MGGFVIFTIMKKQPIAVFDSGYGGLTVLREIVALLPTYDYLYLGDNGRAPYGPRSFDEVYRYTLEAVTWLFSQGCPLVILACNTASAKALRTIQQNDLSKFGDNKRVLGVIRPTAEVIGKFSKSGHVGVLGTQGTINSGSYMLEIAKYFPELIVTQQACPMWVPLIENDEYDKPGADYFVNKNIEALLLADDKIDSILLGCTHYPLLINKIKEAVPEGIGVIEQGHIVASSLANYLQRHPELAYQCSRDSNRAFFTTGDNENFDSHAGQFFGQAVKSTHLQL